MRHAVALARLAELVFLQVRQIGAGIDRRRDQPVARGADAAFPEVRALADDRHLPRRAPVVGHRRADAEHVAHVRRLVRLALHFVAHGEQVQPVVIAQVFGDAAGGLAREISHDAPLGV